MPRTLDKRSTHTSEHKKPIRQKKDTSCDSAAPRVPNARMLEAGQAVQKRAVLALEKAEERSTINPIPTLQNNANQTSVNTPREEETKKLAEITRRFNAGEALKAVILDVCNDVAEIVEDQTQQERSLIGELSHSQKFSKKIDATFGTLYGVKHNHSPALTETISTENMGTFTINIKKIGETERNREIVEQMLRNPELRPIAYAKRPAINGKKLSLEKFFNDTYGAYRDSESIYLNEIKILDEGLYKYLGSAGKHITSTMKKCTDHVNADIALLAKVSKRAENVMKSLYGR